MCAWADGGDGHGVGPHHAHQRRDLAGVVHADLEHGPLGVAAACAPGSAARRCGCCRTSPTRARGRRGRARRAIAWVTLVLPTEPVTAPRRARGARSRAATPNALQRLQRVADHDARADERPGGQAPARRAASSAACDELMAVAFAGQGDEQVARLQGAGVDGDAGRGEDPRREGGRRSRRRLSRPRSRAAQPWAGSRPSAAGGLGDVVERMDDRRRRSGPARGPCRRPPARRRRRSIATAARDRLARSPISRRPLAPARICGADGGRALRARVVVGDDGDVGQTRRRWRPSAAACPCRGRRRRRRRRSGGRWRGGAERVQHRLQPIGRVGVVDIGLAALCGRADPLQPARRALEAAPAPPAPPPSLRRRRCKGRRRPGRWRPGRRRPAAGARRSSARRPPSFSRWPPVDQLAAGEGQTLAHRPDATSASGLAHRRGGEGAERVGVGVQHGGRRRAAAVPRTAAAWRRDRPPSCRDSRDGPGSG